MIRISQVPGMVPATVAQQIFTIGSGVFAGIAGFVMARQLANVREVPVTSLAFATLVSGVISFIAAIALGRSVSGENV